MWTGINKDRNTLVHVYIPRVKVETRDETVDESAIGHINIHALKSVYPDLDTSIDKNPLHLLKTNSSNDTFQIVRIFDYRISPNLEETRRRDVANRVEINDITTHPTTGKPLDLTRIQTGDPCPLCEDGTLTVQRAVEVGAVHGPVGDRLGPLRRVARQVVGLDEEHVLDGQREPLDGRDQRLARRALCDARKAATFGVRRLARAECLQVHASAKALAGSGEDAYRQLVVAPSKSHPPLILLPTCPLV